MAYVGALGAIGDSRYILYLNILFVWPVGIGLSYVSGISLGWGIIGVYLAIILGEGIRGVLAALRWRRMMGPVSSISNTKKAAVGT